MRHKGLSWWFPVILLLALVGCGTCGCLNLGGGTMIACCPRASLAKDVVGTSLAATQADDASVASPGLQNPDAKGAAFRRSTDTGMSGDQGVSAVKTEAPTDSSGAKNLDKSLDLSVPIGGGATGVAGAAGTLAEAALSAVLSPSTTDTTTMTTVPTATSTPPAASTKGASAVVPPGK